MYQALYRAYRPETFSEILGQEHIVRILKNQIARGELGHAYLFCGTRGTGKTTMARILAKAVNCLSEGDRPCGECETCMEIKNGTFMDVIEIDAASHNSVDNIRELRESVKYPPAIGRKKVYIIDEVHMLSVGACNALLKTLEEPPEYCMFILATTEPEKLLPTILSRCIRFDFKRVPERTLKMGMKRICEDRNIDAADDALSLIAVNADGSVRDGLSILDQCLAGSQGVLTRDDVVELLGIPMEETLIELTHNVAVHNVVEVLLILDRLIDEGKDARQLMKEWLAHYRALLIAGVVPSPEDMLNISKENAERIKRQSESLELEEISRGIRELSRTVNEARFSTQPRVLLELCAVNLCSEYEETKAPSVGKKIHIQKKEQEVKEEIKEESMTPEEAPKNNIREIWDGILSEGIITKPDLRILENHSQLVNLNESTFTVSVPNKVYHIKLENSRELFENLMEKKTGIKRRLDISDEVQEKVSDEKEIAKKVGDILNLNVEIK